MESSIRNCTGKQLINLSKTLSKLLRHEALNQGVEIRSDGFCKLNDVLKNKMVIKYNPTFDDIMACVNDNNKKRFEIQKLDEQKNEYIIRAVQGHSIQEVNNEELLERISISIKDKINVFQFNQIVHGTYKQPLKLILQDGLSKMGRTNIHMAIGLPGKNQVISGMRNSCEIVVEVNIAQAAFQNLEFFISKNSVILTPGNQETKDQKGGFIPSQFFRSVFDINTKEYICQQEIEFLCVYDFECNCSKDRSEIKFNEIIEFPVIVVDAKYKKVVGKFHTYVKPTIEPQITEFCTELTGIHNDTVFGILNGEKVKDIPTIEQALQMLHEYLLQIQIFNHEFIFVSCGDFDGRQLKREALFKNFEYPNYLKRWINLKKVFPSSLVKPQNDIENKYSQCVDEWKYFKQIEKVKKPKIGGMEEMLNAMGLKLEGRHHSGIDDAMNISSVVIQLLKGGFVFNQAMIQDL